MSKTITNSIKIFLQVLILTFLVENVSIAQLASPTIKTTKIDDSIYEFFTYVNNDNSVNTYAVIGSDGILLIDAGYRRAADLLKEELAKISDKPIRYIINTHHNGDHTGANAALDNGATIIAHEATRNVLLQNPNFLAAGLPTITFQDSLTIYFDGEEIDLKYFPGHTSSDIIVYFKELNMVFLGDLAFSQMFPLVQPDGSYNQLEESISQLSTMFSDNTRIFPSHGSEIKRSDLVVYLDMMKKTKAIVLEAIKDGKMPDDAKKDNILKDWRAWDSKLLISMNAEGWIDNLYTVLDEGKETSAIFVLRKECNKAGLNAMVDLYKKITSLKKRKHFFVETDFNVWGYELIAAQKITDALEVFKINTEMFPDSWNAYDSLAETYMTLGNKKLAIKNYEKSLELNSQNTNAVEQLKKLKNN